MDNITVGGVTLHSPLLNAAGTMGFGSSYADYIDLHRLGGLVTRTMTVKPRAGGGGAPAVGDALGAAELRGDAKPRI